jgi:hypothetical protein
MSRSILARVFLLALVAVSSTRLLQADAAHVNLVKGASFESHQGLYSFDHWEATPSSGSGRPTAVEDFNGGGATVVQMGMTDPTPSTLKQTIPALAEGKLYTVSLDVKILNCGADAQQSVQVEFGTQTLLSLSGSDFATKYPQITNSNFMTLTFQVVGTGAPADLIISMRNENYLSYVDMVSVALSTEQVFNGGFENGLAGWKNLGDAWSVDTSVVYAETSSASLGHTSSSTVAYLMQNLQTVVGQTYAIKFSVAANGFLASATQTTVKFGGQTVFDVNSDTFGDYADANGWASIEQLVTATTTTTLLGLGAANQDGVTYFDAVSVRPVDLVSNGGFETGVIDGGWTTDNDSPLTVVDATQLARSVNAQRFSINFEGGRVLRALPPQVLGAMDYVRQTLATVPGQQYVLSFAIRMDDDVQGYGDGSSMDTQVSWDGQLLEGITGDKFALKMSTPEWAVFEYTVTASGRTTELQFGLRNDISNTLLDTVSVVLYTPPVTDLVVDGDFASNGLTMWAPSTGGAVPWAPTADGFSGYAAGVESLSTEATQTIQQTLTTVVGDAYQITFALKVYGLLDTGYAIHTTVKFGGQTIFDLDRAAFLAAYGNAIDANGYVYVTAQYGLATTASTVLSVSVRNDGASTLIDSISVVPYTATNIVRNGGQRAQGNSPCRASACVIVF